jgi:hypothetical protein
VGGGFPDWWPRSLDRFHLCVEAEASPNMMTSDGMFMVGANCSVASLVELIGENLEERLCCRRRYFFLKLAFVRSLN